MTFVALFVLFLSGVMIAAQACMNAALSRSLGLMFFLFLFSFLQWIFSAPGLLFSGRPIQLNAFFQAPLWQYCGALLGVFILGCMAFGLTRLSAFGGFMAILSGQLFGALMIDSFGLFGFDAQQISFKRILGLLFVVVGMWLSKVK